MELFSRFYLVQLMLLMRMQVSSQSITSTQVLQRLNQYKQTSIDVNERLQTNKKVNNARQDAVVFLQSASYDKRIGEIESAQDRAASAIQLSNATITATQTIDGLLSQMETMAIEYKTEPNEDTRDAYQARFGDLILQIAELAEGAEYGDENLLYDGTEQLRDPLDITMLDGATQDLPTINIYLENDPDTGEAIALNIEDENGLLQVLIPENDQEWDDPIPGDPSGDTYLDQVISNLEEVEAKLDDYEAVLATSSTNISTAHDFHETLIASYDAADFDLNVSNLTEDTALALSLQTADQLATQVIQLSQENTNVALRLLS